MCSRMKMFLAFSLAAMLVVGCTSPSAKPPNIIFIMADDHAFQAISAYGSNRNTTPNIDRIADAGMRFDRAYVTNSICAPSRAVILTGLHSHLNGVMTNAERFDQRKITFPRLLQSSGYETAMVGKWHLKSDPVGFDYYEVLLGQGPYYNPRMKRDGELVDHTGYTTDIIADLTIDWLREGRSEDKPFLLMCQHKAPHRNWQPGPEHINDFEETTLPEPDTLFDTYENRASPAADQEMTIANHLSDHDLKLARQERLNDEQRETWDAAYVARNEAFRALAPIGEDLVRWKYQRYAKDYLRCVASIDDCVGRILDELEAQGIADNTIVVYTSDQGWYLGEHGWYDKRWMYEESFRTPLLVQWPDRIKPASTNADLVQNLDFAPTFLDAAGVQVPPHMQGQSLVPLLKGKKPADWRDSIYYQYYEHPGVHNVARHYGVRTTMHKLIHYYKIGEWELFDLESDPDELENLYGTPGTEALVADLKAELSRLREQYRVTDSDERDAYDIAHEPDAE